MQASAIAAQDSDSLAAYWRFHRAVARAQLTSWLAEFAGPRLLLDISAAGEPTAGIAADSGHTVVRVLQPGTAAMADGVNARVRTLTADGTGLEFLADGCADGVIAEGRTLSLHLAAETLISDISRVLRPSGRVLASVDSLVLGMAVLAEQHHWPELVDLPQAEVVLVPWPDGTITRCYGTEQLLELFTGGGLEVSWIRPRTVFSASTVSYLLGRDPGSLSRLVNAELLARPDDSVGAQLVVAAIKR